MRHPKRQWLGLGLAGLLVLGSSAPASAATFVIVNVDGAGEGFNDPTAAAPVGGNPGTTRGQQRLNVFQRAADIWGDILPSPVTIRIQASFDPLFCDASSAVLGGAAVITIARNHMSFPLANTWYPIALANKLAGSDLSPNNDILAQFNVSLDDNDPNCFGDVKWYYGFDANEGTDIDLLSVVLHEIGHGLGFTVQISNLNTGAFPSSMGQASPTLYSRFMIDNTTGERWSDMTNAERAASAVNTGNVVWDGTSVTAVTPNFLDKRPSLVANAPPVVAGTYTAFGAMFGAPTSVPGVTAPVVLVDDGVGPDINDGCEALVNGGQVAGNIAMINRGTCSFESKALVAQNAGAIGAIIVDNGLNPLPDPLGEDPVISGVTIPVIAISLADGNTLKAQLGNGLNCTITRHPTLLLGADDAGHVRLYAPNPVEQGSSISHWDTPAAPDLLMEPFQTDAIYGGYQDLTRHALRDIGWFTGSTIVGVPDQERVAVHLRGSPNPFTSSLVIEFNVERGGPVELDVFGVDGRRVKRLVARNLETGPHSIVWDGRDDEGRRVAAGVYHYLLKSAALRTTGRVVRLE